MNREQIQNAVVAIVDRANKRFQTNRPVPVVKFCQKGRYAGRCWPQLQMLEFNEVLARQNSDTFMETIIHEVAHLFTNFLHPYAKQAHGPEFRSVCQAMGGTGRTYHNYDISSVSRKKNIQRHIYKCACREHKLSTTLHNRARRGASFSCKFCGTKVAYIKSVLITR